MKKIKIGWKVVEVNEEGYTSTSQLGKGLVIYNENTKTFPNKGFGPLCLFKTLKAARKYDNNFKRAESIVLKIFKAEYLQSDFTTMWSEHNETSIKSAKRKYINSLKDIKASEMALADWIKLKEEVE